MGSKNQHKNINADSVNIHTPSGSSASTSSKQVSKASKKAKVTDDDSDSQIFGDIGGRGSCEKRIGADFFNTEKKVLVLFGEIYSDEKNVDITWETEPIVAAIVWSKSCNDKKQAGICVDDTGFAGWDTKHKVYLTYDSPITKNKFCMKILDLNPTPTPPPPPPEPDFSSFASDDETDSSKPKDSDLPSKKVCSYSFSKGKNKGETCGKSVLGESDYCKTHSKTGAKQKGVQGDVVTAITAALKELLSKDSTPLVALTEIIEKLESSEVQSVLSDILKTHKTKVESKEKTSESESESDSETEKKSRTKAKVKKEKDPNAPKRPLTPYILFCMAERDTVKSDNPSMSGKEITSELGRLWQDLSQDKKDIYTNQYKEDKVRYADELSKYDSGGESPSESPKKKSPTGPKRGLSSYIFFCQENRAIIKKEEPDFDAKEVTRELGRRWSSLSDTEKEPFIKLAEADKIRYEKEKSQSDDDTEPEKIKPSPKKTTKSKSTDETPLEHDSDKDTPKTKGTDGFTNFVLKNRQAFVSSNTTLKPKQIMTKLKEAWDEMDDEDKLEYNK